MTATRNRPSSIGWTLLAVAFALPWLLPIHQDPWTTFYGEALAAAVMVPVALWVLLASDKKPWSVDVVATALAAVAMIPLAQAAGGMFVFSGESWLVSLYLCALACLVVIGRQAQELAPLRLLDTLFAGLTLAGVLSAGLTIYQWMGWETLGVFALPLGSGGRAAANLAQPNNLSTLLVWGIVGLWWAMARRQIKPVAAALVISLLLIGVVLTRSRTGWLLVFALGFAAMLFKWPSGGKVNRAAVAGLLLWFVLLIIAQEPLNHYVARGEASADLSDQTAVGRRPLIWRLALTALLARPWLGYGWNQSVRAHVEQIDAVDAIHITVQHAHNVLLDLLLWNGVPIGLLLIAALFAWIRFQWTRVNSAEGRLVLIALTAFLGHAMLELPHAYAFFLFPVALMVGCLNAMHGLPVVVASTRWLAGCALIALVLLLGVVLEDYRRVERQSMAARMAAAAIYNPHPENIPKPVFLGFLQDALDNLNAGARSSAKSDDDLVRLRRTLQRYPTRGALFGYARASALNGRPDDAQWALKVLCKLHNQVTCAAAIEQWKALASDGATSELAKVIIPAVD